MGKYQELNKWFNLDNYNSLSTFSIERIKDELFNRIVLFHGVLNLNNYSLVNGEHHQYYEKIFTGNPFTTLTENISNSKIKQDINLTNDTIDISRKTTEFSSSCTKALFKSDLQILCNQQLESNKFVYEQDQIRMPESVLDSLFVTRKNSKIASLIMIDLKNYSDEEILLSTKELLPKIRKELNIYPPKIKSEQFSDKIIKKMIDYRVLPIIDLCAWAKLNDYVFSYEELAKIIFPMEHDEIKRGRYFRETILPFSMQTLSSEFIRGFELYIHKMGNHQKYTQLY